MLDVCLFFIRFFLFRLFILDLSYVESERLTLEFDFLAEHVWPDFLILDFVMDENVSCRDFGEEFVQYFYVR